MSGARRQIVRRSTEEVLAAIAKNSLPKLFDFPKAISYTGLNRTKLYREMRAGRLQCVKDGQRTYFTREQLDQLIERIIHDGR